MFAEVEEIGAAVEALFEIASNLNRGEILTHEQIQSVLGVGPHEGRWDHIVGRVRRRLEKERGIATWPETTVGYKLATVQEQLVDIPKRRQQRGMRQLRRGRKSVLALPEKSLTMNQRRIRATTIDSVREAERHLRREMKVQKTLATPTQTGPRRSLPASAN
jgi:hypothetical protein